VNNPVLLDSSAWFALAEGEPGAEEVEAFLAQAWDGQMVSSVVNQRMLPPKGAAGAATTS
jgi:uncharacterized protein with PIN domain